MTTAIPNKAGAPQALAKLLTSSPAAAARQGLALVGRETLWAADILVRLTVSVLVLRAVSRLTTEWFFPRQIWDEGDRILKGFAGEDEAPPVGERPRLIHEHAGYKFYAHRTLYQGQKWPCYFLRPEPCAMCEFFVAGEDGRDYCSAVVKIRTLGNEHFKQFDVWELKDELVRQYGDRRRRNTNGTTADPSRPGCL
jgi:hypothetical protein